MDMKIHLPDDIAEYDGDLRFFFDLMIRKLHLNRAKGWGGYHSPLDMLGKLKAETAELEEAIKNESQFNAALEAADTANMALLTALVIMRVSKQEYENGRA